MLGRAKKWRMWKINVSERREKEENQGETEMFLETLKKIDLDGKKSNDTKSTHVTSNGIKGHIGLNWNM